MCTRNLTNSYRNKYTGQVKTLSKEQRHLFCKIIIALADEDKDTVVALMKEAGFRSKYMDPDVIYLYAKVCYDEDNKELTNGKHIQLFMEDIQNMDPIIHLPSTYIHFNVERILTSKRNVSSPYCHFALLADYIMVGRASILLRGLAHMLQQSRSVAKSWKSLAERVLKEDL
jgi:aarF domain-containing kinase